MRFRGKKSFCAIQKKCCWTGKTRQNGISLSMSFLTHKKRGANGAKQVLECLSAYSTETRVPGWRVAIVWTESETSRRPRARFGLNHRAAWASNQWSAAQILTTKKPASAGYFVSVSGSSTWARTRDLRINSPALYRLSY